MPRKQGAMGTGSYPGTFVDFNHCHYCRTRVAQTVSVFATCRECYMQIFVFVTMNWHYTRCHGKWLQAAEVEAYK